MSILKRLEGSEWACSFSEKIRAEAVLALEKGNIIYFPALSFPLLPDEYAFLSPSLAHAKAKNISFNRATNILRCAPCSLETHQHLKAMLQRFSMQAEQLIRQIFVSYRDALELGRTSFRPVEIAGRASSYRKDDSRLHVDAFPATPNQGRRILRVFSNINPFGAARHWRIGEPFAEVAARFLSRIRHHPWPGSAALLYLLNITKSKRTPYDHLMLQLHNKMKADTLYQATVPQQDIHFAAGSSWIVQTDHVSHAAMAGQHVLEQTFYLPVKAMENPALSPLKILEKLTGRILI
ncbi:MAG: hypothetical protein K0S27_261 [Gammaproteobacteria bacterium]|jgi:hypothetical protein|nr:hypothetical protein [Gammaproteobacteria bacterium]